MRKAIADATESGVTHMAFGDLFLADIREYRLNLLDGSGIEPLFPILTTAGGNLPTGSSAGGKRPGESAWTPSSWIERFVGRNYD